MPSQEWIDDCIRWRGKVLDGKFAHWCDDWDGLPIDETTPEWPCAWAEVYISRSSRRKTPQPTSY